MKSWVRLSGVPNFEKWTWWTGRTPKSEDSIIYIVVRRRWHLIRASNHSPRLSPFLFVRNSEKLLLLTSVSHMSVALERQTLNNNKAKYPIRARRGVALAVGPLVVDVHISNGFGPGPTTPLVRQEKSKVQRFVRQSGQ